MLKKLSILLFTFLLVIPIIKGQELYLDSLFNPIKSHRNITYGNADHLMLPYFFENFTTKLRLTADIYQPENLHRMNRPCIIFAHGGSFLVGSKRDISAVAYAKEMASRGYVVMAINYRMGYNALDKESAQRAVYRGVQDMKAAIRYAKEHYLELGIDPQKVIAAGNSAGGIMSVHTAYLDESEAISFPAFYQEPYLECLSCTGNSYDHLDIPIAVANLWGGIADTSLIDERQLIPIVSFHGADDHIVDIDENSPHGLPTLPVLQGSNVVMKRINNLGIENEYHVFQNKGHEPWGLFAETEYFDIVVEQSAAFFHKILTASDQL